MWNVFRIRKHTEAVWSSMDSTGCEYNDPYIQRIAHLPVHWLSISGRLYLQETWLANWSTFTAPHSFELLYWRSSREKFSLQKNACGAGCNNAMCVWAGFESNPDPDYCFPFCHRLQFSGSDPHCNLHAPTLIRWFVMIYLGHVGKHKDNNGKQLLC